MSPSRAQEHEPARGPVPEDDQAASVPLGPVVVVPRLEGRAWIGIVAGRQGALGVAVARACGEERGGAGLARILVAQELVRPRPLRVQGRVDEVEIGPPADERTLGEPFQEGLGVVGVDQGGGARTP